MQGERRQLAAVMLTDMVGFSALTQREEALVLKLAREQDRIIRDLVVSFQGLTVKSLGDGVLAEFASALDAVACALKIQEAIDARNRTTEGVPIVLRIGVHLGDVVLRDDDVFGDAVNIVARVEPFAEHGGVCVTQQVFDQVRNKIDVAFRSIGTPHLKNIDAEIQLYNVVGPRSVLPTSGARSDSSEALPRIVVLPFANISPVPHDEYFADGMTEELIEKLAHLSGLRVIARTTAMHYKDSRETALEIGRTLRVQMVLEASVRKAGNRVRITAQLIETSSEEHLWSASYDRELDDIFAIQDDISNQIASAISERLSLATGVLEPASEPVRPDTTDMRAYTDSLQAREIYRKKVSEATVRHALSLFERAVAVDPNFARARVGLAECLLWLAGEGALPFEPSNQRAREELLRSLALNEALAEAHSALAGLLLGEDDMVGSRREALRAVELNPSLSDPYRWLAQIEAGEGRIDAAVRLLEEAYEIDPLDVNVIAFLGRLYSYAERTDEAFAFWEQTKSLVEFRTNQHRTEYYLAMRDFEHARRGVGEMLRIRPGNAWSVTFEGILAALEGDDALARQSLETLRRLGSERGVMEFFEGIVYYALGDVDRFFEQMDRALELHNLPLLELMYSPLYAGARSDPRFDDLLRRQREQARPAVPSS